MGIFDDDDALLRLINAAQAGSNVKSPWSARSASLGLGLPPTTSMPGGWSANLGSVTSAKKLSGWEDLIEQWSADPSNAEQDRIDRTIRMVQEAIDDSETLKALKPDVRLQGSYRNRTNTRLKSDIDVLVLFHQTALNDWAPVGMFTAHQHRIPTAAVTHTPAYLKEQLRLALEAKFGTGTVKRGTKALAVKPSSARVDADVVAAIDYFYHLTDSRGNPQTVVGTAIAVGADYASNFPEDHFYRGNEKDNATNGAYKKMVRFFKTLNQTFEKADQLPSFYVESLIFNCRNSCFAHTSYYAMATAILNEIEIAVNAAVPPQWHEANLIKKLWHECRFRGGNFEIAAARRFVKKAKGEMGLNV